MNLAQLLVRAAHVFPDRPAVLLGDRIVFSYRELADRAARLASHLRGEMGLALGDRVALFMTNNSTYLEILYAAWWAGLSVVPINCKLHSKEVEFILADAGASVLFVSEDLAKDTQTQLGNATTAPRILVPGTSGYDAAFGAEPMAPEQNEPDDLAWLFYTSGTTGRPKGVMQTHRMLFAMTACYFIDVDDVSSSDAIVYAAPMSHGAGIYNFAFVARAARHVVPVSGGFDPAELVHLSQTIGRLCMFAAPTMVKRLTDYVEATGAASDGFKTIVYGGGPMYADDILEALGDDGTALRSNLRPGRIADDDHRVVARASDKSRASRVANSVRSVGMAQIVVEVRIVDADGATLPIDRNRRNNGARRNGDGTATGVTLRRPRRRCGADGSGPATWADGRQRLPDAEGPLEGRDHQRRLQHLSARGRGGPAVPPRRARGFGGRRVRSRMGRDRRGLRRRRRRLRAARARRVLP